MKKYLIVATLLVLLATVTIATDTFGLFESESEAIANAKIAKWIIYVNEDLLEDNMEINLEDFTFENRSRIKENTFAPGSTGKYQIEIDNSQNDVGTSYELSYSKALLSEHPNIEFRIINKTPEYAITKYEDDEIIKYVGKLPYGENSKQKLEIELKWNNDENYNEQDSLLIKEDFKVEINAIFNQAINE